jgi:hypothetical protein
MSGFTVQRENPAMVFALRVSDGKGVDYGIKFNGSDNAIRDPPSYLQKLDDPSKLAMEAATHGALHQQTMSDLSSPLTLLTSPNWLSPVRLNRLPVTAAYSAELGKEHVETFILDAISSFGVHDLQGGSRLLLNSYMAVWLRDESQAADESQVRAIIEWADNCFTIDKPMSRLEHIGLIASDMAIINEALILAVFDHWDEKQGKIRAVQANEGRRRS